MLNIIINAYACAPNKGSEPGMAWNWIINLAKHCNLHIITEGEWRSEIENEVKKYPFLDNLTFYYLPVSEEIRQMCWNQGDWRFYYYYRKWQQKAYWKALQITKENKIDILHQLNMIGFREPGFLWNIPKIPFVWGPVDAKEKFPVAFLKDATFATKFKIHLKNQITTLQLKYSSRVRNAVSKASFVISASSESVQSFHKYYQINSPLINETGCYTEEPAIRKSIGNEEQLKLLWVGKFDFRKQPQLALKAIAAMQEKNIELHLVGATKEQEQHYQQFSVDLGISSQCVWHGIVSHQEVQQLMLESDLFLFTSVAEGTPHVVLEAIANQLPVLCFDSCGQGDCINNSVGIKIFLSNPEQAIKDFSQQLSSLFHNRALLQQLSKNCINRAIELSWNNKANQMVSLYHSAINSSNSK